MHLCTHLSNKSFSCFFFFVLLSFRFLGVSVCLRVFGNFLFIGPLLNFGICVPHLAFLEQQQSCYLPFLAARKRTAPFLFRLGPDSIFRGILQPRETSGTVHSHRYLGLQARKSCRGAFSCFLPKSRSSRIKLCN